MHAIEVSDLVVRYGSTMAVDGVSFIAESGAVTCLLGRNGAGKTTTVETLEGYRKPASGSARVDAPIERIGVMLQRGGVYPSLSPTKVLRLFASYYDDPLPPGSLIDRLQLGDVAGRPWRRLSGGEQQRVSLALALVGRPSVVFLDEPTSGVDPSARQVVRQVVRDLRGEGVAVLLTTHDLADAEALADHVVIIDRGRVVADGTLDELRGGSDVVTFRARPGLDVSGLGATEVEPGRYRVSEPLARVASWFEEQGEQVDELRTQATLEDVFLRLTEQ